MILAVESEGLYCNAERSESTILKSLNVESIGTAMNAHSEVALIVGAGSQAGQQAARLLHAAGFRVALNDQMPNRVEALAAELGDGAAAYPADLSRKLSLQTMLQAVLEAWERIDVLVFVPTVAPHTPILDMDEWDWHRTIDSNLTAAFLAIQSAGRIMRQLGGGAIVNILVPEYMTSPVFQAATQGLAALCDAVRPEFAQYGVSLTTLQLDSTIDEQILSLVRNE